MSCKGKLFDIHVLSSFCYTVVRWRREELGILFRSDLLDHVFSSSNVHVVAILTVNIGSSLSSTIVTSRASLHWDHQYRIYTGLQNVHCSCTVILIGLILIIMNKQYTVTVTALTLSMTCSTQAGCLWNNYERQPTY